MSVMTVYLDGRRIEEWPVADRSKVGEVVDRAKARLTGSGAIVFGIRCDDEEIPSERIKDVMSKPASAYQRIDLISGRPKGVVLEVLAQTRAAFGDSFAIVRQAADDLARGQFAKGMSALVECVGIWSNVHEAVVQGGALVGIEFDRLVLRGRPLLDWLKDLQEKLRDMKRAIESRDQVVLVDMLRYEMDDLMIGWENMLDAFIEHVGGMNEGAAIQARNAAAAG